MAVNRRLRMIDETPRLVPEFPPTFDCDLALRVKAELDLELSESDLDERRAGEKVEVQIGWHPVHESGVLSLPAVA